MTHFLSDYLYTSSQKIDFIMVTWHILLFFMVWKCRELSSSSSYQILLIIPKDSMYKTKLFFYFRRSSKPLLHLLLILLVPIVDSSKSIFLHWNLIFLNLNIKLLACTLCHDLENVLPKTQYMPLCRPCLSYWWYHIVWLIILVVKP